MNWHSGNIAEAVAESKAKNAIFVVYIAGQDEMSANLNGFLNDSRVYSKLQTSDFVAVKIEGESPTYAQFLSLYKVVPVPSIFFIGNSGTPLEIATGIIASVEELVAKINKVLLLAGKQTNPDASTSSSIASESATRRSIAGANDDAPTGPNTSEPEITVDELKHAAEQEFEPAVELAEPVVVEPIAAVESTASPETVAPVAPVAQTTVVPEPTAAALSAAAAAEKRAAAAAQTAAAAATTSSVLPNPMAPFIPPLALPLLPTTAPGPRTPAEDADLRVADIQNLVEQRRQDRLEEQKRRDKDSELRRRREGRESQVQQTLTREQELKLLQESIRRERLQEQATRGRILAQIAADRAEQANRTSLAAERDLHSISTATTTYSIGSPNCSLSSVEETRLQIRLPGGITRTKAFPAEEPLATVRGYVLDELLAGSNIREFTLATSYPRREFTTDDETKTLNELNLVPNAVLLVLKSENLNRVVRSRNNIINIVTSMFWAILTPAAVAFDYINKMGLQRLRIRFIQFIGWAKPAVPAPDAAPPARNDVASRRNMDMFILRSTEGPGLPPSPPQNMSGTTQQQAKPTLLSQEADAPEVQESGQQRGFKPTRYGESNIRRLADTLKDDEEDKSTYNGNSTQQQ